MKRLLSGSLRKWIVILALTSILVAAGCATAPATTTTQSATPTASPTETATTTPTESATPTSSPSPTPSASPSATPTSTVVLPKVVIVKPLYNVTITPGDVTVEVKVTNFNIVDKIGQPNTAGEGHVIFYKDVTPPTTQGATATTAAGTYFETANTSYTWAGVGEGQHTFSVQLVNNDGTPLVPAIVASEPVPVATPTPSETATPSATP